MTTDSKLVGPVIRGVDDEVINAVIEAAEQDNGGKDIFVEDRSGYVRVHADHSFVLTRTSMEEALGRPFRMSQLEASLVSFAGRLIADDEDKWEWALSG